MSRDTEYQRLTSDHPADHWVQRASDEQNQSTTTRDALNEYETDH